MTRQMSIGMQKHLIDQAIIKAGYDPETFDVISHIDSTLSLPENMRNIKKMLQISRARPSKQQINSDFCSHISEQCEIKCDTSACRQFKKEGCPGSVEPCGRPAVRKERVCPIIVRPFCVNPYSYTRAKDGRKINVKGHCQGETQRRCRE